MASPPESSKAYEVQVTDLDVQGVACVCLTESNLNHFSMQAIDPDIRQIIAIKAGESYSDMIIDISKVEIVDSSGVGLFVSLHNMAGQLGVKLHICGADPKVARIMRIMQLHRVIPFHASMEAAMKACKPPEES
ncbi:MAG: STAS domain-containing protein [Planctomycetota bacterium]|jgi:anti-anti-sigma factor